MSTKSRYIECIALFLIIPCIIYFIRHQLAFRVFFLLAAIASVCGILLFRDPGFDRTTLRRRLTLAQVRSMAMVFIPIAVLLSLVTYFVLPSKFLAFPMAKPTTWLYVMVLYPFLMVLPQELLFRSFFFHRYGRLFNGKPCLFIFANALSFGLSHLFYGNWVAPALSFLGGLLFAWRYHTTRSLIAVSVEHAVWGNFLFTIGIGWYFYSGSIS